MTKLDSKHDIREEQMKLLRENNISFTEHNLGRHLIIYLSGNTPVVDFWPGVGRWHSRIQNKRGFGTDTLIRYIHALEGAST